MLWPKAGWTASDQFRRTGKSQQDLARHFEIDELRLHLLRQRVHVTHPPLERLVLEDRRSAGEMIDGLDDLPALMNGVDGRQPQRGALLQFEGLPAGCNLPHGVEGFREKCAQGAPLRLSDCDPGL